MSRYAFETFQDERDHDERVAYKAKLTAWLRSRPEVGTLNRAGGQAFYTNFPYTEIAVFSE